MVCVVVAYPVVQLRYGRRIRPLPAFALFARILHWVRVGVSAERDRGDPVKQAAPMLSHTLSSPVAPEHAGARTARGVVVPAYRNCPRHRFILVGLLLHETGIRPLFHVVVTGSATAQVGRSGVQLPFREDIAEVRGTMAITAPRMTAALQVHLREGGMTEHFTMHSFRAGGSLSKSLAGTAVDEIMKIGGWKTERVTPYYIGATTGAVATSKGKRDGGSRRERDDSYAIAMDSPLPQAFQDDFAACKHR